MRRPIIFVVAAGAMAVCAAAGQPLTLREKIEQEYIDRPVMVEATKDRPALMAPEVDAAGAVDGVRHQATGFHTQNEENPWWQVDLGEQVAIGRIIVANRNSSEGNAKNLIILLSDDARNWRQVYQHGGTTFYGGKPGTEPLTVKLDGPKARYVRLSIPKGFLHLNEVEVYPIGSDLNVALSRPATQSSASQWSTQTVDPKKLRQAAGWSVQYDHRILDALKLARRTLEYVESSAKRPGLARRLDEMEKHHQAGKVPSDNAREFYLQLRWLRREIILSHPELDFASLLINKRPPTNYSHMCDQYLAQHNEPGPGLVRLDDWKSGQPKSVELLKDKLPEGCTLRPDLSFDGRRVVFAFNDCTIQDRRHRRFWLYELDLASGRARQITGTPADPLAGRDGRQTVLIEDWDPCYLPDGGIVFVSTRNQTYGRCHGSRYTPAYMVYRMTGSDAGTVRPLSFGEANEWDPAVLHDGRIIYTRWDYINRHDTVYQSLWTIRPDGTRTQHFFGNSTRNPCMIAEAHAVPGSDKVVATAMAHHSYTTGSIILISADRGEDGIDSIERVTPETAFPETEGYPAGTYANPWPINEQLFLAAWQPNRMAHQGQVQEREAYGIYLVDTLGGRELIYRDDDISCWSPIPLRPRAVPPVLPSHVAQNEMAKDATGVLFIQNVNLTRVAGLQPGSVKSIRVNEIFGQPARSKRQASAAQNEIIKGTLGTARVADDGSVAIRIPAGVPLQLQALDANGMAVLTMRSVLYVQPGETLSCAGCHEPAGHSPTPALAPGVKVQELAGPPGPHYAGAFSFARTVQPVLDRNCIGCHGLDKLAGKVNLLGTRTLQPVMNVGDECSQAYASLVGRAGWVVLAQRNSETPISQPRDYFAHASKLAKFLMTDPAHSRRIDRDGLLRIANWLDLNAQYHGDYSHNRAEFLAPIAEAEHALRQHIAASFPQALPPPPAGPAVAAAPAPSLAAGPDKPAGATGKPPGKPADDPDLLTLLDGPTMAADKTKTGADSAVKTLLRSHKDLKKAELPRPAPATAAPTVTQAKVPEAPALPPPRTLGEKLARQPFEALVNRLEPAQSRILLAPLATQAGGWGQIDGGWKSTDDPGYRKMLELVGACIAQPKWQDVAGTCGHPQGCRCGCCWVREYNAEYRKQVTMQAKEK